MPEYCCDKMKTACDWGDDCKGDREMRFDNNNKNYYMACADCQTECMDPINFCPYCGKELKY